MKNMNAINTSWPLKSGKREYSLKGTIPCSSLRKHEWTVLVVAHYSACQSQNRRHSFPLSVQWSVSSMPWSHAMIRRWKKENDMLQFGLDWDKYKKWHIARSPPVVNSSALSDDLHDRKRNRSSFPGIHTQYSYPQMSSIFPQRNFNLHKP